MRRNLNQSAAKLQSQMTWRNQYQNGWVIGFRKARGKFKSVRAQITFTVSKFTVMT
jgi:hypothetical protein